MQKFFRGTCFPGNALLPTAFLIERQASLCSSMPSLRLRSSVPSLQRNPNPSQSASIRRAFFARANSNPHRGSVWLSCGDGGRRFSFVEASKKDGNCVEVKGDEMEKKAKGAKSLERRNRGENRVNGESIEELLAIPGVGQRNLRKLADKGFQGVAQLKQLYRDKVK